MGKERGEIKFPELRQKEEEKHPQNFNFTHKMKEEELHNLFWFCFF